MSFNKTHPRPPTAPHRRAATAPPSHRRPPGPERRSRDSAVPGPLPLPRSAPPAPTTRDAPPPAGPTAAPPPRASPSGARGPRSPPAAPPRAGPAPPGAAPSTHLRLLPARQPWLLARPRRRQVAAAPRCRPPERRVPVPRRRTRARGREGLGFSARQTPLPPPENNKLARHGGRHRCRRRAACWDGGGPRALPPRRGRAGSARRWLVTPAPPARARSGRAARVRGGGAGVARARGRCEGGMAAGAGHATTLAEFALSAACGVAELVQASLACTDRGNGRERLPHGGPYVSLADVGDSSYHR